MDKPAERAASSADRLFRRFSLLGPLQVRLGRRDIQLTGKGNSMVAGLLLNANKRVSVQELTEIVWGRPSGGNRTALHTLISRVRQTLGDHLPIRTVENGYLMEIAQGELDLHEFAEALAVADAAALEGDSAGERRQLARALSLWKGPALGGVPSVRLRKEHATMLDEQRLGALSRRIDLDISAGASAVVIGELHALVAKYPLHEGFAAQLMLALARCSRRAEALSVYRSLRRDLVDKAGIEPGAAVTALHEEFLASSGVKDGLARAGGRPERWPIPEPEDALVGRSREVADLSRRLTAGGPASIIAIAGLPGVGKSRIAVEAARQVRHDFDDGHWFLRFESGRPGDPATVLLEALLADGVPADRIPAGPRARGEMLRGLVRGRRILLVADSVVDSAALAELLPRVPGFGVVIVPADAGSKTQGGWELQVRPFDAETSVEFLAQAVDRSRLAAEAGAVRQLVRWCDGLPRALEVVRAWLVSNPDEPVAALCDRLRDPRTRLSELANEDNDVRAGLAARYHLVDSRTQLALRLSGLLPPGRFGAWSLGVLANQNGAELVRRLMAADLAEPAGVDEEGEPQYRMPSLVALYSRELAAVEQAEAARAAVRRLVDALVARGTEVRCMALWTDKTVPVYGSAATRTNGYALDALSDPAEWVLDHGDLFWHAIRQARDFGWRAEAEKLIDVVAAAPKSMSEIYLRSAGGTLLEDPASADDLSLWER
ncbi:BTAD domain-containing putative transcriptional regulator [Amycolatopsis sp. NPDC059090]|uniref:BTAD domain-containing putative transcriptional regulator n=1 Tax=unclassified Amycolatopsis TaxID=2618356 RepID=UPI00366D2E5B